MWREGGREGLGLVLLVGLPEAAQASLQFLREEDSLSLLVDDAGGRASRSSCFCSRP